MKYIVIVTLFVASSLSYAIKYEGESFVFSRQGRDKTGISIEERFHIRADNTVLWKTVSRGDVECPREAGTFKGEVDKKQFEKLVKLGIKEIENQKKMQKKVAKENGFSRMSTISSMTVWSKGKDYHSLINEWTDGLMNIDTEMAKVMGKVKPIKALRMEAKSSGKKVEVTFKNIGNEIVDVIIPHEASEAFYAGEGVDVKYQDHTETLKKKLAKGSELVVRLKLSKKVKNLSYRNHLIKHHKGHFNPMEVAICAPLGAKL